MRKAYENDHNQAKIARKDDNNTLLKLISAPNQSREEGQKNVSTGKEMKISNNARNHVMN